MDTRALGGFLLIAKPAGITSFDCIRHIRKIIGRDIKIGHAGTLDPFASGLLIIAVSRNATKHIGSLHMCHKRYTATGQLGYTTDTLDSTGTTVYTCPSEHVTCTDIQQACIQLQPTYTQTPPLYSALKHKGDPLYAIARSQTMSTQELHRIAETKQRTVTIYELIVHAYNNPLFTIDATVSGGTYIRSLINDIAQHAGSCATTTELVRTEIGPCNLSQAQKLEHLVTHDDIARNLIDIQAFLDQLQTYVTPQIHQTNHP